MESLCLVHSVCLFAASVSHRAWGFCFAEHWPSRHYIPGPGSCVAQAAGKGVTQWTGQQGDGGGYLLPVNNSA